jgi:hypothetical protein
LQVVGQNGLGIGITLKKDHTPDFKLLNEAYKLAVARVICALENPAGPYGKKLTDFLFEG